MKTLSVAQEFALGICLSAYPGADGEQEEEFGDILEMVRNEDDRVIVWEPIQRWAEGDPEAVADHIEETLGIFLQAAKDHNLEEQEK